MSAAPASANTTATGFYHCSVKGVGRANGRSIVAAAAYRHGERLEDEITGQVFDYRARGGVLDSFILAPDAAPAWAQDRGQLWNEAERAEKASNGRMATELELALPHEISAAQRRELLNDYLRPLIERYGVAADVAIHAPGNGRDHRNIHAHVLITHRTLGPEGFGAIANERFQARTRTNPETKKKTRSVEKISGIAATPADIRAIRKGWEQAVNHAYELAGLDIRVDHRSHKERGITQEPTVHIGPQAGAIERRGESSELGQVNREITQRNAARETVAKLEAEVRDISAQIYDLQTERARRYGPLEETQRQVQREQLEGRYDALRAAEPPPEAIREFASGAARSTEPTTPTYDRDAADAEWLDKVAEAGIAKDEAQPQSRDRGVRRETPRPANENEPHAPNERPLGKTAGDIRMAWSVARPDQLETALAARGITLALVSAKDAQESHRRAAFAKATGNYAPEWREGEIVAVDGRGQVYRLDARTTGDERPEIEGRLAGIERASLLSMTEAQEAMPKAAQAVWREERRAERERVRPPSAIEKRILDCDEKARLSGAAITRDAEGRMVFGAEALADRLKPADERENQAAIVYGPEAFVARLAQAGIAIVRVTDADVMALESLRRDEELKQLVAGTNRETYNGQRFDDLLSGELAAVTHDGSVFRINADKLDGALDQLPDNLPSVTEARAAFEIDREKTDALWAERRAEVAAEREVFDADRPGAKVDNGAHATSQAAKEIGSVVGGAAKVAGDIIGGLANFLVGGAPKLTRQQVKDRLRAQGNLETLHARAYEAAEEQKAVEYDDRAHVQKSAQEQHNLILSQRSGRPATAEANVGRDRDDGYERERERER